MANIEGPTTGSMQNVPSTAPVGASTLAIGVSRSVLGWAGVSVVLLAFSAFPATGDFAASFAWLIFVAVLLSYGQQAFANVQSLMTSKGTATG